jgi:hypothetical protein
MADETYRRYHSGRYPEYTGGPGQASYEAGSKTGYFREGELPVKENIDLTATKALRKATGMSDTGESGIPAVTRARLKKEGVE